MKTIKYTSGYKYQLAEDYYIDISVHPKSKTYNEYVELLRSGLLRIRRGYAWDGPSGPTLDTSNFMRGSLVHDALYQLMRQGWLHTSYRKAADKELRRICIEDGMSKIRAWWVYKGLRIGGKAAADAVNKKKIKLAPIKINSNR